MTNAPMLIKLRDLHEDLSSINDDLKITEKVDDETIDALGQLVTDLNQLADQVKDIKEQDIDLTERHDLLDRVMRFETKHPHVTRFLSQITDVLAMMGI